MTLGHPLGSNLDPGLAERLEQCLWIDAKCCRCLAWERVQAVIIKLRLVVATLCLIDNTATGHYTSSQHIAGQFLLSGESQDVEGILSVEELLVVIDGVDLGLSLRDIDVVVDVRAHEALGTEATLADVVTWFE